jgi:hypothetical protein
LHSKHWKEKFVNILDAIRGEFGKNTSRKMSKISSTCVQTNHRKEKFVLVFVATPSTFFQRFTKIIFAQLCLLRNQMKEIVQLVRSNTSDKDLTILVTIHVVVGFDNTCDNACRGGEHGRCLGRLKLGVDWTPEDSGREGVLKSTH